MPEGWVRVAWCLGQRLVCSVREETLKAVLVATRPTTSKGNLDAASESRTLPTGQGIHPLRLRNQLSDSFGHCKRIAYWTLDLITDTSTANDIGIKPWHDEVLI